MSLAAVPAEPPARRAAAAPGMRAADADRDRVAAVLADALATGRIDPEEHAERLEAVYSSRTLAELAPLTADLPEPETPAPSTPVPSSEPVAAVLSKLRRGGQWPVPPHSVFHACMGAIVLDLRHAVFTRREVVIEAGSFWGKVVVIVPDNARVLDEGTALMGKRSLPTAPPEGGEGPVIRFTGRSVMGHLRVVRRGDWRLPFLLVAG